MKLLSRIALVACFVATGFCAQTPEWIWHDNHGRGPADNEVTYFRKIFTVKGKVQRADLAAAGDDKATVYVNGKEVVKSPLWNKASHANVTRSLKEGENVIAAMGKNTSGDAAFIAKLDITYSNGEKE